MKDIAIMAGYYVGHALASVSGGEVLIPIFGYLDSNNERKMRRVIANTAKESVNECKSYFEKNPDSAKGAVMIYQVEIEIHDKIKDALDISFRDYESGDACELLFPFSAPTANSDFIVHNLMSDIIPEKYESNPIELVRFVLDGIASHEDGKRLLSNNFAPA